LAKKQVFGRRHLYRLSGGLCAAIRECVGLSTVYKRDGGALARVVRVSNVSSWCKHGTALPYLRETCACDVPCPPLTSCARHSYSRQYRDRGDAAAQSCPKRSASGTFNIEKGVDLCQNMTFDGSVVHVEHKMEYNADLPEIPPVFEIADYLAEIPKITPVIIETDSIKKIVATKTIWARFAASMMARLIFFP
jgi:hypothetical protein